MSSSLWKVRTYSWFSYTNLNWLFSIQESNENEIKNLQEMIEDPTNLHKKTKERIELLEFHNQALKGDWFTCFYELNFDN